MELNIITLKKINIKIDFMILSRKDLSITLKFLLSFLVTSKFILYTVDQKCFAVKENKS